MEISLQIIGHHYSDRRCLRCLISFFYFFWFVCFEQQRLSSHGGCTRWHEVICLLKSELFYGNISKINTTLTINFSVISFIDPEQSLRLKVLGRYQPRVALSGILLPAHIWARSNSKVTAGLPIRWTLGPRREAVITRSNFKSDAIFGFLSPNYMGHVTWFFS